MAIDPKSSISFAMTDDELHHRMREARPSLTFPPDFQREIWGRIEAAEIGRSTSVVTLLGARLLGWVARPTAAVALAALMGGAGCLAAMMVGRRSAHQLAEMRYLKSVSPFAAANLDPVR